MSIVQIKSLVQFTRGTSLVWEALLTPIPAGVVSFSIDDGTFKLGDGTTLYPLLPVLFTFNDLVAAQGGVGELFTTPTIAQNGNIVVIVVDPVTKKLTYSPSATTLASLFASLADLEADNSVQDIAVANILAVALSIDASVNTAPDGNFIVINNGRYSDSGMSVAAVESAIAAANTHVPGSHMRDVTIYSDIAMTTVVDKLNLNDNTTYYVNCVGFNNDAASLVFGLTCAAAGVVITSLGGSLFSVAFNNITGGMRIDTPVVLIASVDDGSGNTTIKKAIAAVVLRHRILVTVFGGVNADVFYNTVVDGNGDIICVGYSNTPTNAGGYDGLICKFDANLNLHFRKRYGGLTDDQLYAVTVDAANNIFVAGRTNSEGQGNYDLPIAKFDTNLNLLAQKTYGGTANDQIFFLAADAAGNVYGVGVTSSEGQPGLYFDGLVVKFDNSLNFVARKHIGGSVNDQFIGIAIDKTGNVIIAGWTMSDGLGSPTKRSGLVIKLDSGLNIVASKTYGSAAGETYFYSVATDTLGNIICAGWTLAEGLGGSTTGDALVVKFDTNLNILARKIYGGTYDDQFFGVTTDKQNNIICIGQTYSEGGSLRTTAAGLLVKFGPDLSILARKIYGGTGNTVFRSVITDAFNNVVTIGNFAPTGAYAGADAGIIKFPSDIPSGTFTGTKLTGLTITDSNLTLADSALTLANTSTIVSADSTLTLIASALTLADSSLNQIIDIMS